MTDGTSIAGIAITGIIIATITTAGTITTTDVPARRPAGSHPASRPSSC
jgi:hypothetical protein